MRDYSKPVLSFSVLTSAERFGACEQTVDYDFSGPFKPEGIQILGVVDCPYTVITGMSGLSES